MRWKTRRQVILLTTCMIMIILVVLLTLFLEVRVGSPRLDLIPTPIPNEAYVQNTSIPGITFVTAWHAPLMTGQSTSVFASLVSGGRSVLPNIPEDHLTQVPTELTPVGTPNVPIAQALGSGHNAFANARLDASSFEIEPPQQPNQSLDQSYDVQFIWIVTPKYTGIQTLDITITGIWVPTNGGKEITRPLAGHLWHLEVTDTTNSTLSSPTLSPFFSLGQFTLGDFLVVLLGAILSTSPLWWKYIIKKFEGNKQKMRSPLILPPKLPPRK